MTKRQKVAILKRTYDLARQKGWRPGDLDRVPTPASPDTNWEAFLTAHGYAVTLIATPTLATAIWGVAQGKMHRNFFALYEGFRREDDLFAYLANQLPVEHAAEEAARVADSRTTARLFPMSDALECPRNRPRRPD